MSAGRETEWKGVRWRRQSDGHVFFLAEGEWIRWGPGVDAPPLPPRWGLLGVPTRVERPGWRSHWRIVPLVLVVAGVVFAVVQVFAPPGDPAGAEARKSAALLGRCLAQDGTAFGHPRYSSAPVPCSSSKAAVRVSAVLPTTPGSPLCPAGTDGVEVPYPGVRYPHVECLSPIGQH